MKMSQNLYDHLNAAMCQLNVVAETERQRWDCLWQAESMGLINIRDFYNAGLNDNHIDTALRRIFAR